METKLIISGYGGQGIVFAGKLLAETAMHAGRNTTYFPSYGIAMRGGAAKCDVIVSDAEIGSPVIDAADGIIAMSTAAMGAYAGLVRPGGVLLLNDAMVEGDHGRKDVETVRIDAAGLAAGLGSPVAANIVLLGFAAGEGALFAGLVALEEVVRAVTPPRFADLNIRALRAGAAASHAQTGRP
jgi:2-oxoglutarate ferredoxin oxidoreductase subunit gamma